MPTMTFLASSSGLVVVWRQRGKEVNRQPLFDRANYFFVHFLPFSLFLERLLRDISNEKTVLAHRPLPPRD
jgi:hypothetical protein